MKRNRDPKFQDPFWYERRADTLRELRVRALRAALELGSGGVRYRVTETSDATEGWTALELHRPPDDRTRARRVARSRRWDASGRFSGETFATELPVGLVEELVALACSRLWA